MLQFIRTGHCNDDTMKRKKKSREEREQTLGLLNLQAYPFGIKVLLLSSHISPIPYRSHGPETLRSGQHREHWVLYKSILCPKHFAAPGTPGRIIKRLARSSLPHRSSLRWELGAAEKNDFLGEDTKTNSVESCRVTWGQFNFHYSRFLTAGEIVKNECCYWSHGVVVSWIVWCL